MMRSHTAWIVLALAASPALAQEIPTLPPVTLPEAEVAAPGAAAPDPYAYATLPDVPGMPKPHKPRPADASQADSGLPTVPGMPAANQPVAEQLPETTTFSFGDAKNSILFTPAQIGAMKKALSAFESIRPDTHVGEMEVIEASVVPPEQLAEPATYPVYYLSSIAYHNAKDWTVWLNNARITPRTNEGEVVVTSVSPDRVSFSWTPTYIQAVAARQAQHTFAPVDKVKHRMTVENTAAISDNKDMVTFSLRPNQSFVAGYMHTFEGSNIPAPAFAAPGTPGTPGAVGAIPTPMNPQDADTINGLLGGRDPNNPGALPPTVSPNMPLHDPDRSNMQDLIQNQERITPREVTPIAPSN